VTRKKYGKVPRQAREFMPDLYDAIKASGVRKSPYAILAEAFGVSLMRIQQITLAERRSREQEARHAESAASVEGQPAIGTIDA